MGTGTLSAQAGHALRWGTLTTLARFGLQLGAQVLLARLLGPAAYGVYALGIAVLTFASFLAGTGFSHSLVLRPAITERDIRLAFTWQTAAGLACGLAIALGAEAMATFFREPTLAPTLRWMALACALTAMGGTAISLMQRDMDLRRQGLAQIAAYAAGYLGVGLPLALAGWQAQALAVACVVQAAVTLGLVLWLRPHPKRPLWHGEARLQTLDIGRAVFLTNGVNWLSANLDRLVIGRVLQAQAVGLYALAWNLSQIPVTLLVGTAQPALLAAGTRLAGDRKRLGGAWLLAMTGAAVLLPAVAGSLAMLARDLVAFLYGPAWQQAGWLLALMLLCLPAWTVWALSTPVLWHSGQPRREASLQLPLLALALPAWWWAAQGAGRDWDPTIAVAGVSVLLLHLRAAVTVRAALRCVGLSAERLLPSVARGGVLAAVCVLALVAAQSALAPLHALWPHTPEPLLALLRLAAGAAAALVAGLVMARSVPGLLGGPARALLRRAIPGRRRGPNAVARVEAS